jgi:hypothetical protein
MIAENPGMSFKDEVKDAMTQVVSIRVLIQQSRRLRPGEKIDEEKEKKKSEKIAEAELNLKDLPPDKIDALIAYSQNSLPMELDEIVHKLERLEFLLEDVSRGKDRKSNMRSLIDSLKTAPVLQNALLSIQNLNKLTSEP